MDGAREVRDRGPPPPIAARRRRRSASAATKCPISSCPSPWTPPTTPPTSRRTRRASRSARRARRGGGRGADGGRRRAHPTCPSPCLAAWASPSATRHASPRRARHRPRPHPRAAAGDRRLPLARDGAARRLTSTPGLASFPRYLAVKINRCVQPGLDHLEARGAAARSSPPRQPRPAALSEKRDRPLRSAPPPSPHAPIRDECDESQVTVPVPETLDLSALRARASSPARRRFPCGEQKEAEGGGPDELIVAQLMSMGFGENGCKRAALAVKNASVEAATDWVMQHMGDDDFNEPLAPAASSAAGANAAGQLIVAADVDGLRRERVQARGARRERERRGGDGLGHAAHGRRRLQRPAARRIGERAQPPAAADRAVRGPERNPQLRAVDPTASAPRRTPPPPRRARTTATAPATSSSASCRTSARTSPRDTTSPTSR